MHNNNARYKLALGPFCDSALENEPFRKFINLAADCVISFNKKKTGIGSMNGNVELFFGDFSTLQSAMQRLCQLTVFSDKSCTKGSITCTELKPPGKNKSKDQWKANFSAKLFFQFSAEKREKLQQLISSKGRKKEDTKRKCVQLHRIPSSINEEMLSLLFPFSVGVKISNADLTVKDIKGPAEIEFENQEWMEAVLVCFKDFSVSTSNTNDRSFNLYIKNFTLPKEEKSSVATISDKQKQVTSGSNKDTRNQRDRSVNQVRDPPKIRNLGAVREGKPSLLNPRTATDKRGLLQNRNDQRKRAYPGTSFGQRVVDARELAMKRRRLENAGQVRELARADRMRNDVQLNQHTAQSDVSQDTLRQLAIARGLDPSNPDVLRILEMTAHLEQLQGLAIQQNAEAKSLGIVGLSGQQAVNEHQLQLQQQALALKQAKEDAEARRFQAQNVRSRGFGNNEQAGNSWPRNDNLWQNVDAERRREEEEQRHQEQYLAERTEINRKQVAERLKQLEEMDLLGRQGMPFQRGQRGADLDQSRARKYAVNSLGDTGNEFAAPAKIQPYGHAPATTGLLGAVPRGAQSSHSSASIPAFAAAKLAEQQKADNLYNAHELGFNQRERHMRDKNGPRSQNVPNQQSSNRSTPRTERFNTLSQKSLQSNQTFRDRSQDTRKNEDNRKPQGLSQRKLSGRQSRWNTDEDQSMLEPDRNDTPLEFNRPRSGLTTEQAFKQDIERTRAVLATHMDGVHGGRSTKPRPLMQITKPLLEEVRDRHGLPVQFGKNAAKRVPKEIDNERRRNVDVSLNARVDSFAAEVNAINPRNFGATAFKNTQDNSFKNRRDTGPPQRGGVNIGELQGKFGSNNFGNRRETTSGGRVFRQATELGTNLRGDLANEGNHRIEANVRAPKGRGLIAQRGGIDMQGGQRGRQLSKGQVSDLRLKRKQDPEDMDVFEFENQCRRNGQETPRSNDMSSGRNQGGHVWQEINERQDYFEHDQEEPQSQGHSFPGQADYGRNEWGNHGGHFAEKGGGYRVAQDYSRQHDAGIVGLQSQQSQIYEEEQYESNYGQATGGRPFESRNIQKFAREEEQADNYEQSGNFTRETGFGGYQAGANFGAAGRGGRTSQTKGRGRLLGRGGGHGNIGESEQSFRKNVQLRDPGRGLLDLPEQFKQQEDTYYEEENDQGHLGATSQEFGHHQPQQSFGRNNRMLPSQDKGPIGRLLGRGGGHGNVGESAQGFRKNVQLHEQGRGLLDLPEEYKQQDETYYEEGNDQAGQEFGHYQPQQSFGRNNRMLQQAPPPPLLGHGVNFF